LEVPEPEELSDEQLIQRLQYLYPADQVTRIAEWLKTARDAGLKRKNGARPLRQADAGNLCTMRDLRKNAIYASRAA